MPTPLSAAFAGFRDTIPLIVGTTPFAIIFGTLVVSAGLPPEMALALSAIVFAGSAQFISISLIGGGAALPVIWLTTFVVNLRHALYSATVQPATRHWPLPWRIVGAFWLTDECFAIFEQRIQAGGERNSLSYYLGTAIPFYANWVAWTAIGAYLGNRIPGVATLGLDFAMIATFTAMIAPQFKALTPVAVAATAGGMALAAQGLPYKLGLMLAALAGMAVGVLLDCRRRRLAAGECA